MVTGTRSNSLFIGAGIEKRSLPWAVFSAEDRLSPFSCACAVGGIVKEEDHLRMIRCRCPGIQVTTIRHIPRCACKAREFRLLGGWAGGTFCHQSPTRYQDPCLLVSNRSLSPITSLGTIAESTIRPGT